MILITLASTSPLAPLIWLGIVIGVVGVAVWHNAAKAGPMLPRPPEPPPEPTLDEATPPALPRRSPSTLTK